MDLPDSFLPHTVLIRPLTGSGGAGPVYGSQVPAEAFIEDVREVVRDQNGAEVVSDTRVHVRPETLVPVGSKVTVWAGTTDEREAKVVKADHFDRPDNWAYRSLSLI